MKNYEGMFIFKPDLNQDGLDKTIKQIHEVITKNKGSLEGPRELGKQRLAYPIKKFKEGAYYIIDFHIDPEAIAKIRRSFSLNESILRVQIVNK